MRSVADVYAEYQRQRWMRPGAHRWIRPDAARWTTPLHPDQQKYSPSQPRDWRGRWTDGGGGSGNGTASPMGQINLGDLPNFSDLFGLFQITPRDGAYDGVQLASDGKPLFDSLASLIMRRVVTTICRRIYLGNGICPKKLALFLRRRAPEICQGVEPK